MDAVEVVLEQHAHTHAAVMAGLAEGTAVDRLLDELTDDELRRRPFPRANSIVWLLWHLARSEDLAANVMLGGRPQVLDGEGWLGRLGLTGREMGTGANDDEVGEVTARIDIPALLAYRVAVGRRTRDVVRSLGPGDLEGLVDASRLLTSGAFADPEEAARRVASYWSALSKQVLFTTLATHSYTHLGEAGAIKTAIVGLP